MPKVLTDRKIIESLVFPVILSWMLEHLVDKEGLSEDQGVLDCLAGVRSGAEPYVRMLRTNTLKRRAEKVCGIMRDHFMKEKYNTRKGMIVLVNLLASLHAIGEVVIPEDSDYMAAVCALQALFSDELPGVVGQVEADKIHSSALKQSVVVLEFIKKLGYFPQVEL